MLAAGIAIWLRERPLAGAAAITAVVMIVFSLGSTLTVGGLDTGAALHALAPLPVEFQERAPTPPR